MNKTRIIAAITAIALGSINSAGAVVWNGSVNFDFTLGANWDGGVAPPPNLQFSNQNVTINAGTPLAGLVTPSFIRVGDLDVAGTLHINGPGEIRINQVNPSRITGQVAVVNGGTLSTDGGGEITLQNSGELHITTNGRLVNRGTPLFTSSFDGMFIRDSSTLRTSGNGVSENFGQITQTGGTNIVQDSGIMTNVNAMSDYLHDAGSIIVQDSGRFRILGGRYVNSGGALTV